MNNGISIDEEDSFAIHRSMRFALESERAVAREKVAKWMRQHSLATGHGDTLDDLLKEASWQVEELRSRLAALRSTERKQQMDMPHKDYTPVTDKELRKLRVCALCPSCHGCTKDHIHCRKCQCSTERKA